MPHCSKSHVMAHMLFTDEFKPEGSESDDEETIDKDEEGIDEVFKKHVPNCFFYPRREKTCLGGFRQSEFKTAFSATYTS